MKIKTIFRIFAVIAVLFCSSINALAADPAQAALEKCSQTLRTAPSLRFKFALSQDGKTIPCTLVMSKNKFCLASDAMTTWYDGRTQWTYIASGKELSITEPTPDELSTSNPFAILENYLKLFNIKKVGTPGMVIDMTAKSKNNSIRKAVITIDPSTNMPTKIVATLAGGKTVSATITNAVKGKTLPNSVFQYNKAKYPASEINDLR